MLTKACQAEGSDLWGGRTGWFILMKLEGHLIRGKINLKASTNNKYMIAYILIYLLLLSLSWLSGSLYINSHYVSLLHSLIFCFIQPTLKAIWTQRKKAKLRLSSPSSSWWNPSICFIMFHLFWNPHLHHIDRVLLPQHATFDLREFGAVVKPPVPQFQWWKVPTNWLFQTEQVQAVCRTYSTWQ